MKTINFTRYRFLTTGLSLACIVFGFLFTAFYYGGINTGVDFNPGVSVQFSVKLPEAITDENAAEGEVQTISQIRQLLAPYEAQLQEIPNKDPLTREYRVRLSQVSLKKSVKVSEGVDAESVMSAEEVAELTPLQKLAYETALGDGDFAEVSANELKRVVEEQFGEDSVVIKQKASVTPSRAATLTSAAIWVVVAAMALVLLYVWFRFRFSFAVGAIMAVIHDILMMVVFIGVFQVEFTSVSIAAILTIIGYSLNDTIVVFDRVRESMELNPHMTIRSRIDVSVTQTLSRTIITSLTTLFTVVALYVFAADTSDIKNFALNVIVGIICGTYSTIFIAAPFYYWTEKLTVAVRRRKAVKKYGEKAVAEGEKEAAQQNNDEEIVPEIIIRKPRRKK